MKLTSPKTKDEILEIIKKRFNAVNNNLTTEWTERNFGEYKAMVDLLSEVKIYEEEE